MNEDPEGLKQSPWQKRPITYEWLESFNWNNLGTYQVKLSASSEETILQALIIARWAYKNQDKIMQRKSDNYDISFVKSYLSEEEQINNQNNEMDFDFGFN